MPIAPKGLAKNNTSANDGHHHERVVPRAIEVCIWAISLLPHFTLTYYCAVSIRQLRIYCHAKPDLQPLSHFQSQRDLAHCYCNSARRLASEPDYFLSSKVIARLLLRSLYRKRRHMLHLSGYPQLCLIVG